MALLNFDATTVDITSAPKRGPLPKGIYTAIVSDTEIKTTQRGDGQYISVKYEVIEGEHQGRWIWQTINISNPSKQAEEIAQKELASLCTACNVSKLKDTMELHDIPVHLDVDIDRKDPERNRVMGTYRIESSAPAKPAVAAPASAPKASAKPWERK